MDIHEFLMRRFLPRREGLTQPDGRLLYLYRGEDDEFWPLVDLLKEAGSPDGHDFDRYRELWQSFRARLQSGSKHRFDSACVTDLDWTVRGFVLYASEFWRRFKNEDWRARAFPDGQPFQRLTWLQFLSLVGWTDLYHGNVVGHITLRNGECGPPQCQLPQWPSGQVPLDAEDEPPDDSGDREKRPHDSNSCRYAPGADVLEGFTTISTVNQRGLDTACRVPSHAKSARFPRGSIVAIA